ncbi:hypothetical protein COW81_01405 [Candidatus Campbellbacteria bacterium CG22_combo_CG10-13_8_21_14_all_36_13]|uniref:Uncharacterized protein n=1 Tax=Candidatus Campbellbacteria bacterium CG22_combo_CG10-13_8_21_14_all_36_13 TaxID=1974529 RepID=A0A2H0DYH5_9BACT|nr:MAG: hypothetical protein COW81_01405 [Candidatus Campbellbacteria bacterium CG22_combo_CG10-13_8_21_14_all_36_13]
MATQDGVRAKIADEKNWADEVNQRLGELLAKPQPYFGQHADQVPSINLVTFIDRLRSGHKIALLGQVKRYKNVFNFEIPRVALIALVPSIIERVDVENRMIVCKTSIKQKAGDEVF